MSLITCKKCRQKFNNKKNKCPNCGAPVLKQKENTFIPFFIVLMLFGNIIGLAYMFKEELKEMILASSVSTSVSIPDNHQKAKKYFNSLQEKEAKYAEWENSYEFRVAVFNNNIKKDNYARYVCLILRSEFNISSPFLKNPNRPNLTVKIYDYMKTLNNVWEKIGEYDCSNEL